MKIVAAALTLLLFVSPCCPSRASQKGIAYNEADKELNATYHQVLAQINDPEDRKLFVESQRAWLKYRDARAAFHERYFAEGGFWVSVSMIQARTEELKRLLTPAAREARRPQDQKR